MELHLRTVVIYETESGKVPYQEWFEALGKREQIIIDSRLTRIRQGNLRSFRSIGKGAEELR